MRPLLRLVLALALLPLRVALGFLLVPLLAARRLTRRTYRRLGATAQRVLIVQDRRFAHPVAI